MIILDDFDPNVDKTREKALSANYITVKTQDIVYNGISPNNPEDSKRLLEKKLGFKIKPNLSFFRYYTSTLRSPNFIHSDLNFCDYIGIHFLHKCDKGGFATWSHKETGYIRANYQTSPDLLKKFREDSQDESKWRNEVLVSAKYNRLVVYDSSGFHSHYPKKLWGSGPKDGRLIQVFFFDKA